MTTDKILALARKHLTENSNGSDRFCMYEAVEAMNRGDLTAAKMWAVKSLAHSVGVFHPDYKRAVG